MRTGAGGARPGDQAFRAATDGDASSAAPPAASTERTHDDGGRDPHQVEREMRHARQAFHRAASDAGPRAAAARQRRSAALQAFFVANTGRSLLPASETTGAIAPQLKPEEP